MFKKSSSAIQLLPLVFFALTSLSQQSAIAKDGRDASIEPCAIEKTENNRSLACDQLAGRPPLQLRDIARLIHEGVTGETDHPENFSQWAKSFFKANTWRAWIRGFTNFGETILNFKRSINILRTDSGNSADVVTHAQNFIALYGVGEFIEIVAIPAAGTYFNVTSSASALTKSVVGTLAYITPLPGIEPACLALIGCYMASQTVRTMTTQVRRGLSSIVTSGFRVPLQYISEADSPLNVAQQVLSSLEIGKKYYVTSSDTEDQLSVQVFENYGDSKNRLLIALSFTKQNLEDPYLNVLTLEADPEILQLDLPVLIALSSLFGKNIKSVVSGTAKELLASSQSEISETSVSHKFYFNKVTRTGGHLIIQFRPRAITVEKQRYFHKDKLIQSQSNRCQDLLNSK